MTMTQEQAYELISAATDTNDTNGLPTTKAMEAQTAIAAALTATPGVPDGMRIVPVEPTWGVDAMSGAGAEALPSVHGVTGIAGHLACNVYRAMLAAAPPAPAVITRAVTTAAPDHIPDAGKMVADAVAAEREACITAIAKLRDNKDAESTACYFLNEAIAAIRSRGQGGAT